MQNIGYANALSSLVPRRKRPGIGARNCMQDNDKLSMLAASGLGLSPSG
jgi:hypothetical protein